MPRDGWYSNSSPKGDYLVRTRYRPASPYVSTGPGMALTPREKAARAISKTASSFSGGSGGMNTMQSTQGNFFSAQLSTDFLELPQSIREKRELYRHFYNTDELVGQAIDLHTELPLSKVRLAPPKPRTCPPGFEDPHDYGQYILSKFERMCKKIKLFQNLITIVHHYWLEGSAIVFAEDSAVDTPMEVGHDKVITPQRKVDQNGTPVEVAEESWVEREDLEDIELAFYQKNYEGWDRLIVLPLDKVKITTFSFVDGFKAELIPSDQDRVLMDKAQQGDPEAQAMIEKVPAEVREFMARGRLIPLGTDPNEGSFVHVLSGRKHAGDQLGQSILDRCLRTLIFREKLRQAQTQIASRAMTPKRIVWAEGLSDADVEMLREQVDLALVDPDYSIVANYEVHWEEMGARDRLLDLSSEYEQTERRLISGLGVTESLMSGEALYSGDRLKLEVINTRYLHLREVLQTYVHEQLFEPVARRMGFVEKDKWGNEVVLFPRLSFTRLPLRDSQDTFDALYNLYQKGSVSIDLILEMLNIDPDDTRTKLEADLFTVNDATFNEIVRSVSNEVGRELAEKYNVTQKVAAYLGFQEKPKPAPEEGGGGRF